MTDKPFVRCQDFWNLLFYKNFNVFWEEQKRLRKTSNSPSGVEQRMASLYRSNLCWHLMNKLPCWHPSWHLERYRQFSMDSLILRLYNVVFQVSNLFMYVFMVYLMSLKRCWTVAQSRQWGEPQQFSAGVEIRTRHDCDVQRPFSSQTCIVLCEMVGGCDTIQFHVPSMVQVTSWP